MKADCSCCARVLLLCEGGLHLIEGCYKNFVGHKCVHNSGGAKNKISESTLCKRPYGLRDTTNVYTIAVVARTPSDLDQGKFQ